VSQRIAAAVLAVVTIVGGVCLSHAGAQTSQSDEINRRAKTKVQPFYPELARKMNIAGTVKIEVTVAPNGAVEVTLTTQPAGFRRTFRLERHAVASL